MINNAGIALGVDSIENNCIASAKKTLDTNVLGILNLCKSIIPGMIERNSTHKMDLLLDTFLMQMDQFIMLVNLLLKD